MPIDLLTIKEFCSFNHIYDWFENVHAPPAVIVATQCEIIFLKCRIMLTPLGN